MKTTYKVTGPTGFMGHKPGETFDADLDPQQERRAVERGSIKKVTVKKEKEEETDA
jgi:hypothetical protein